MGSSEHEMLFCEINVNRPLKIGRCNDSRLTPTKRCLRPSLQGERIMYITPARASGISAIVCCLVPAVLAQQPLKPSPFSPTNIFSPASTHAETILKVSDLTLVITGLIFVTVFSLLVYAVRKFRRRPDDDGREPAQVYGSTQIEMAWTIIPSLIVIVLFLAAARVIASVQNKPKPANAVEVTVVGHQYWWEYRYPQFNF